MVQPGSGKGSNSTLKGWRASALPTQKIKTQIDQWQTVMDGWMNEYEASAEVPKAAIQHEMMIGLALHNKCTVGELIFLCKSLYLEFFKVYS